jgi:putative phosphoribosyl transferase
MSFASRQDGGQKLGRYLVNEGVEVDVVAGLPRGGVIVAAEVSRLLQRPLEALVVRKIGHPLHREFAVGALAENDVVVLDQKSIDSTQTTRAKLTDVIQEEKERLSEYQLRFHHDRKVDLCGKSVLIVDDGLATGATMEAAVLSARKQGAQKVMVAAPVGPRSAILRLERVADRVFTVISDLGFEAVGAYYESFPQIEDDEVVNVLRVAREGH